MATERLTMRQTREILRVLWAEGRSVRDASASLGVSTGVVSKTTNRAKAAGLDWAAVCALNDAQLERRLYGEPTSPTADRPEPDPARMHVELKKTGVTLEFLHLEYLAEHPKGLQYTAFCDRYRAWKKRLGLTMRQEHKAGERMFVDFSGKKPSVVNPKTGEIAEVEFFVAVLGASSYTFACATADQTVSSWIAAHTAALEYFGGVASVWVPDRLKSGVTGHERVDPTIQRTYRDQAAHYGSVVIPARAHRPRDKAKVEVGVQVVQRWILAVIRNETFFSLEALNARIAVVLETFNARPRRQLGGESRKDLFERMERAALKPLPRERFEHRDWKRAKVNLDYHVEVERHWYSVPHALVHEHVEASWSASTVEIFHLGHRVASHVRSFVPYAHTTNPQHRPANHQAWAAKDHGGLHRWAETVGPNATLMMKRILESSPFRDQTLRSGMALRRVGEKYGPERTEFACGRALGFGGRSYKNVERILKQQLDLHPSPEDAAAENEPIHHEQVRGPGYYH